MAILGDHCLVYLPLKGFTGFAGVDYRRMTANPVVARFVGFVGFSAPHRKTRNRNRVPTVTMQIL
ncbi:MAG TPA: hypothetical protein DEA75_14800 [Rhodobacteraceae bacterium]|nr:hypothetical protein [Paracoccaceae bacterium]